MPLYRTIITVLFVVLSFVSKSQIISQFDWNSNPPTQSVVGPTATSIGTSATVSAGGVGGTNGLNPGTPTRDINMHIPNTSNIFDIPNIDVSIDYRRNESTAQLVKRSSVFTFNSGGAIANFQVVFRVNNGGTGATVTSTAYPIPQDAVFRNYRFTYDNCSGVGTMYVNNVVVWASPTPTVNQNLYWVGESDLIIGQDMDGAGNNIVNLDNFILRPFTCTVLPIELIHFSVSGVGEKNLLKWSTASEKNNDFFVIEKSSNGFSWSELVKVNAAGNSTSLKNYSAYDQTPSQGINYYRLTQTDFDGHLKKFSVIVFDNSKKSLKIKKVADLLGRDVPENYTGLRLVYYSDGSVIKETGQ